MRCLRMTLVALATALAFSASQARASCEIEDWAEISWWTTSSALLFDYSLCRTNAAPPAEAEEATKRHLLVTDIYVKARSYAVLNKVFFWLSVAFGIAVLLWPSLGIVFKDRLENWAWVKSATVQTTVTALAALMFTFYSAYKEKQTYAENLMRHVLLSERTAAELSTTVAEELSRIDRGFSFSSILGEKDEGG